MKLEDSKNAGLKWAPQVFRPLVSCILFLVSCFLMAGCGSKNTGAPVYYQSDTEESARSPVGFVSDTVLMARVKSKFMSDDMVDDHGIHIKVRHGVVYLDGWVSDTYQRRMAEDLVRSIDGVGRVVSRLQISNPGTVFINPDIR
ncbi:putative periplasmic or secreted lipoprotein [Desulfobacter postgatei 2ac9]|uniref:Putative periplasmic or secreted lipoprotein n=1 Tax=Desulfobacter postgatei 2ac9 TaxID=879212 RepID=I5B6Y1_9BACT|nr:putative periplasmic or secreted lipoprotein [Desulfobacter postgatei 2ac9]